MASWHIVLGISINSNETQIKTAYRSLVKQYHPDLIKNKSPIMDYQKKKK